MEFNTRVRLSLLAVAENLFQLITDLPSNIRPDEKERTGIKIFVREVGTRNLMLGSVGHPSEAAQFFATEKAVRSETLGHFSSQNSEDPGQMKFAGSVTVSFRGAKYQASVSGLKAEEDVFIAVSLLASLLNTHASNIVTNVVENHG